MKRFVRYKPSRVLNEHNLLFTNKTFLFRVKKVIKSWEIKVYGARFIKLVLILLTIKCSLTNTTLDFRQKENKKIVGMNKKAIMVDKTLSLQFCLNAKSNKHKMSVLRTRVASISTRRTGCQFNAVCASQIQMYTYAYIRAFTYIRIVHFHEEIFQKANSRECYLFGAAFARRMPLGHSFPSCSVPCKETCVFLSQLCE